MRNYNIFMIEINITIDGKKIKMEYISKKEKKVTKWEDKENLSGFFLLCLDRFNKTSKSKYNCLSASKESDCKVVLTRKREDSVTWRIALITLKTLAWAGNFFLVVKRAKKLEFNINP